MKSRSDKTPQPKSNAVANNLAVPQTENNSPQVTLQRQLQEAANNSPQVKQLKVLQAMANRHTSGKTLPAPKESWHVAQKKAVEKDTLVQKVSDSIAQQMFFRPATNTDRSPHLHTGTGTVQRATLEVTTVDYDPIGNAKHDFNLKQERTSDMLKTANETAQANLDKGYKLGVSKAFEGLKNAAINIAATDIPTLAGDIYADILTRYSALNPNLGPLPGGQKTHVQNAIKAALNFHMKDRIFGHGLQSQDDKDEFNQLIKVSVSPASQNKGIPSQITQAALNGFDGTANTKATAIRTAFTTLHALNPAPMKKAARGAQYVADLATLPAGRDAHHNVAGWLPALPRPATAPWTAPTLDHKRSSVVAWALTNGAPSLYLEFNGGQKVSRIVYNPMTNTTYATMHYTSIGGYNPFFEII